MILEIATLDVKPSQREEFQAAFKQAAPIIAGMKGYLAHQIQECIEDKQRFVLLVWWQTLEDHTVGFRHSVEYQQWRALLHHFYDPFPTVQHFSLLSGNGTVPKS
ncbi:MAG: antibiotic biosynthesis monooxygenase [Rhodospirillales bacterium]